MQPGTIEVTTIKNRKRDQAATMLREVRKAERQKGDGTPIGGTGFTSLKRQDSPMARLLNAGKIGGPEVRASEDIVIAFQALAGALMFRPVELHRADRSASPTEPAALVDTIERYRVWANVWSLRAARSDPTLEIVVAAVIDERAFREIEADLNLRNGRAATAAAAGLRDYAARAGWTENGQGLVEHGAVFKLRRLRPVYTTRYLARKWDREVAA